MELPIFHVQLPIIQCRHHQLRFECDQKFLQAGERIINQSISLGFTKACTEKAEYHIQVHWRQVAIEL